MARVVFGVALLLSGIALAGQRGGCAVALQAGRLRRTEGPAGTDERFCRLMATISGGVFRADSGQT